MLTQTDQGLTLHIPALTQGPWLVIQFALIATLLFATLAILKRIRKVPIKRFHPHWGLNTLAWISLALAPILIALILVALYSLTKLVILLPSTDEPINLRWHILSIVAMITALGGLISAPLALIRTFTTERQTRTAEEGHVTDRFTKAVEQLGADKTVKTNGKESTEPNIEVRLGALYALERIAQDSLRDHIPIMETLCAYIRENTKVQEVNENGAPLPPRADIQAALTIIGRRERKTPGRLAYEKSEGYRLDFNNSQIAKANLSKAELGPVLLRGANLHGATLADADLHGAWMETVNLEIAWLARANLKDAPLINSNLQGAWLTDANLQNVWLNTMDDLKGVWLDDASFNSLALAVTSFKYVVAKGGDFSCIQNFTQAQADEMYGDGSTILPTYLTRPIHWPKENLSWLEFDKNYATWKSQYGLG